MTLKRGDDVRPACDEARALFSEGVLQSTKGLPSGETGVCIETQAGERITLKRSQVRFPI